MIWTFFAFVGSYDSVGDDDMFAIHFTLMTGTVLFNVMRSALSLDRARCGFSIPIAFIHLSTRSFIQSFIDPSTLTKPFLWHIIYPIFPSKQIQSIFFHVFFLLPPLYSDNFIGSCSNSNFNLISFFQLHFSIHSFISSIVSPLLFHQMEEGTLP